MSPFFGTQSFLYCSDNADMVNINDNNQNYGPHRNSAYQTSNSTYGSHFKPSRYMHPPEQATPPNDTVKRTKNPIGLQNTGASCWFNSISQILFHFPAARKLIFEADPKMNNEDPRYRFWMKLRMQFALMQDRQIGVLTPTSTLNALDNLHPNEGIKYAQKDAVEMFTRILTALETATVSAPGVESPLTQMFGGKIKDFRLGPDQRWRWSVESDDLEIFSFPVNPSAGNLTWALEQHFIKDDEERWIDVPAPVMILPITRYAYGQYTTKRHDKFSFPQIIYMDRHLHSNLEKVKIGICQRRSIRSVVKQLTEQLRRFPSMSAKEKEGLWNDIKKHLPSMPSFSSFGRQTSRNGQFEEEKVQIKILEDTIKRYMTEEDPLEKEEFKKHPYSLHAVLMHDGASADAGHYYAFVRYRTELDDQWLLFNDSKVQQVTFEYICQRAFGGHSTHSYTNPSAFALMYVKNSEQDNISEYEFRLTSKLDDRNYKLDRLQSLPDSLLAEVLQHYENGRSQMLKYQQQPPVTHQQVHQYSQQTSLHTQLRPTAVIPNYAQNQSNEEMRKGTVNAVEGKIGKTEMVQTAAQAQEEDSSKPVDSENSGMDHISFEYTENVLPTTEAHIQEDLMEVDTQHEPVAQVLTTPDADEKMLVEQHSSELPEVPLSSPIPSPQQGFPTPDGMIEEQDVVHAPPFIGLNCQMPNALQTCEDDEAIGEPNAEVCDRGEPPTEEHCETADSIVFTEQEGLQLQTQQSSTHNTPRIKQEDKIRIAVLTSASGAILKHLLNACHPDCFFTIRVVASNRSEAAALRDASLLGVQNTFVIDDDMHEANKILCEAEIDLICLDEYNSILSNYFLERWTGRVLNMHPSLLPPFISGLYSLHCKPMLRDNVIECSWQAGVKVAGCTVYVQESSSKPDTAVCGRIISQKSFAVPDNISQFAFTQMINDTVIEAYPEAVQKLSMELFEHKSRCAQSNQQKVNSV